MTVGYECTVDFNDYEDLTAEERDAVLSALTKERFEWRVDKDTLYIGGECEVDDYSTDASDVKSEIQWLLWEVANIDADAETWEIEYEPDWDKMTGGHDCLF